MIDLIQVSFEESGVIMIRTREGIKELKTGDDYHDKIEDWFQGFLDGMAHLGYDCEVETHFIADEIDFFEQYDKAKNIYQIKDYEHFYESIKEFGGE